MEYSDDLGDSVKYRLQREAGTPWHKRKEHPRADQIAKLRTQGYSVPQIAKAFQVHRTTIFRRLKEERLRQEDELRREQERKEQLAREEKAKAEEQARLRRELEATQTRLREARRRKEAELKAAEAEKGTHSRWRLPIRNKN